GLSQKQLGKLCGVSDGHLNRLELGKRNITPDFKSSFTETKKMLEKNPQFFTPKPQVKFAFYSNLDKRTNTLQHVLNLRIGAEIQKHLKVYAGDKIVVTHDFSNEFILYLQPIKNITHQQGNVLKTLDYCLSNEAHKKRDIKTFLQLNKGWATLKSIPKWAKKSSIANYTLLPGRKVLVDLQIR
ncbi:unnamed protein product, partial [marine sediment metagenome]